MGAASTETAALVELLGLRPHPEGGFFRETFRSSGRVRRAGAGGETASARDAERAASTAIYFLLPAGTFSAWHRVTSDEAWHHYDGAPLELHTIDPDGVHAGVILGRDFKSGERPQHVVPAGWYQAARPLGGSGGARDGYALCGCTVSPGFEFDDFEMPARAALRALYPQHAMLIDAFTRG